MVCFISYYRTNVRVCQVLFQIGGKLVLPTEKTTTFFRTLSYFAICIRTIKKNNYFTPIEIKLHINMIEAIHILRTNSII